MKFKRVLIKLSGEALSSKDSIFDREKIEGVARMLAGYSAQGLQMGVVVGGGNIIRGRDSKPGNRSDADHMGMLATGINALALKDALIDCGAKACVMSPIEINRVFEPFSQREAIRRVAEGEIVVFGCGTGLPYFSTDTTAALRAIEINAEAYLCGKNVDGVYDDDPVKNPSATRFETLTFDKVLKDNLKALDAAAFALCRDNNMPIYVFKLSVENIAAAIEGTVTGTFIS